MLRDSRVYSLGPAPFLKMALKGVLYPDGRRKGTMFIFTVIVKIFVVFLNRVKKYDYINEHMF